MTSPPPGPDPDPLADEDALVDEQGEESFPASDPPASWSGTHDPPPTHREG